MNWGATSVGIATGLIIGAVAGIAFSRQRQRAQTEHSHADQLDYPADSDHQTSIATIARAAVAVAKDNDAANKYNTAHAQRTHRINQWTAIGIGAYTVITSVILIFGVIQYGESHRFNKKQKEFFVSQIDIMKHQLELTERPWMEANISFVSPFIFDNEGAKVDIKYTIKNSGHSPAANVWWGVKLHAGGDVGTVMGWENDLCRDVPSLGKGFSRNGFTMFPEQTTDTILTIKLPISDILPWRLENGSTVFHIVACIDYTFTFSDDQHQTSYIFELDKGKATNNFALITPNDSPVAANDLMLQTHPLLPGRAN